MPINGDSFIWLTVIIFVSAFVQGTVGFAFGMIAMGFASLVVDARFASIIIAPLAMVNVIFVLWSVRKDVHVKYVVPMILGSIAGLPIGISILLGGSAYLIRVLVSVLLIYVGTVRLVPTKTQPHPLPLWWGAIAGIGQGIMGGAVNIGGPPLIAYAVRQNWSPGIFKASLLTVFFTATLIKSATLIVQGSLDAPMLKTVAALIPTIFIGSLIGIRLFNWVNRELFGRIVAVLLIALGIRILF